MSRKSQYGRGIEDRVKRPAALRAENISKFSAAEAKRKSDLRKLHTAINKQVNAEMPDLMSAFSNMSTREQVPMDQAATMDQDAATMDQAAMEQEAAATMDQAAVMDQDANSLADQMQGMELEESRRGGKKSKRRQTKRKQTKRKQTKRKQTKKRR